MKNPLRMTAREGRTVSVRLDRDLRRLFTKAAQVVEAGYWSQGEYARDKEGFGKAIDSPTADTWCVTGVVWSEARKRKIDGRSLYWAWERLTGALVDLAPKFVGSVTLYNDTPGRTKEEIAQLLRRAAERRDGGQEEKT